MVRAFLLAAVIGLTTLLAPAPPVMAQDTEPVLYVTRHKIDPTRLDSLTTLTTMFDVPWHDFVAQRVPGYERTYARHDTGDDYNFVIMTTYPDWDYVRGDEIDYDAIFEAYKATPAYATPSAQGYTDDELEAMFEWAYEGSEHTDNIYRPIEGQSWE